MHFNLSKKLISVLLTLAMVISMGCFSTVFASAGAEFILEDITNDENTMVGETKIKVSVKPGVTSANIIQASFKFSGSLKYNTTEYLLGDDNTSEGKIQQSSDDSAANSAKAFTSTIMSINTALPVNATQEAFIISFLGNPGETVTLSIDSENSYVKSGNQKYYSQSAPSVTATAATQAKEATVAEIEFVVNKVNGFTANPQRPVSIEITNERTGKSTNAIIKDSDRTSISPLTYMVSKNVIKNDKYTVTISANGYVPFKITNYDFSKTLKVDNLTFVPGDVNGDEKVDSADKDLYLELIANGEYSAKADFNCDGKTDDLDDVFEGIESGKTPDVETPTVTVPSKMAIPVLVASTESIQVKWTKPQSSADITGYVIKYGTSSTNLNLTKDIANPNTTSDIISNLKSNVTHYFSIAAKNSAGTGEFSDIASISTTKKENNPAGGSAGSGGFGGGGASGGAAGGTTPTTPSTSPSEPFTDLANHGWAKDAIYTLKNKGIINGISATEYAPASNVKRGDFILILTRMLSVTDSFTENFADVPADKYYYSAIGSAKAAGIATGDGINFMPENSITRQDLITLAYRAFLAKGYISESADHSSLEEFADKASISEYALSPLASMVGAGIIKGDNGNLNPKGNATRAEVAVMCARLLELMNN